MFKHTPTSWILQCHRKNLSLFFLSLSFPLSNQSDTVTKLSRAFAHGNTWTWIHWQRHEPEWCLSLTATRTLTLDHQAHTVKTCTQALNIAVSPNKSLSLFPVFFSRSLSLSLSAGLNIAVSRIEYCSVKRRLLWSMFGMQDEDLGKYVYCLLWSTQEHPLVSYLLLSDVLSSTSIKFQGLMSDLAGCTPVWRALDITLEASSQCGRESTQKSSRRTRSDILSSNHRIWMNVMLRHRRVNVHLLVRTPKIDDRQESCVGGGCGLCGGLETFVGTLLGFSSSEPSWSRKLHVSLSYDSLMSESVSQNQNFWILEKQWFRNVSKFVNMKTFFHL